jgi:hypothetical protein
MKVDPRFKPLPQEAVTRLNEGRPVDAVKALRETRDLTLKQAMEWIESHVADNPIMRAQLEARQRDARLKVYGWIVLALAVIGSAIYYFSRAHAGGLV